MAQLVRVLAYSAEGPGSKSDRLVTCVVCLGKALNSHLSCSPERIREVFSVGKYYNLSADRACTLPVATSLKQNDCDDFPD